MNTKFFIVALISLFSANSFAQNFQYKSKIPQVEKSGFYRIRLNPEIASHCNTNFEDLRLFDNKGKEIPFLYKKDQEVYTSNSFVDYPIVNSSEKGEWQSIVIQNSNKSKLDKLIFEMKNADADRIIKISGSENQNDWYVVKDSLFFSALDDADESTVYKMISFPTTDYQYLKVEIKNKEKLPLQINRVGYSNSEITKPTLQKVNSISYVRNDSANKNTYFKFTSNPSNKIDKIRFYISGPSLYHREVQLYKLEENYEDSYPNSKSLKSRGKRSVSQFINFNLTSEKLNEIPTSNYLGYNKVEEFQLEIKNNDNVPLQIDSIVCYQLTSSITAELNKDNSYFIYFGDSLLNGPLYDLVYFENKIPKNIETIEPNKVLPKTEKEEGEYNNQNDKYLVWIGIGIVGVILFLLVSNMLNTMKKEQ